MKTSKLTGAAVSLAVVAALGLSACGDKDESKDSPSGAASSSSPSAAPASAGGDLTKANFFTAISDAQLKAKTSHLSMDIGAAGQTVKAEGDVAVGKDVASTAMALSLDLGSTGMGTFDLRLVDEKFYLNFGDLTKNKFAKVDLNDKTSPFAQQFSGITEQLDPTKQLAQFNEALKSFEKKGAAQKIDGVEAQPYELVLDTSKVAAFSDLPGGAAASVPKTLTYTMYVGPDNLLRRLTADVAGSSVTVNYSKWGEPVEIKAPGASEISDVDLDKLGTPAA